MYTEYGLGFLIKLSELDAKTKEEVLQATIAEMKEKIASLQEKLSKEELSKLVRSYRSKNVFHCIVYHLPKRLLSSFVSLNWL